MDTFWKRPGWEKNDPHLRHIKAMPFRREFPFIPQKKGLYIIRGPRQIGKSTWLKEVLGHYCGKKTCFYLSCENVEDNKELAHILAAIRGTKIILLDELSFVKNWDRAIKHEVDLGTHHIIMATGSHAHDLKRGSDLMPGRFGGGGDFVLRPMLFDEFRKMRGQAKWGEKSREKELQAYFRVGGFPHAVATGGARAKLSEKVLDTYWKWLQGDATKLGKKVSFLEEAIIQLGTCLQTPISYQTLGKKTSIGSHNTVKDYIDILESCFAVRQLYAIDPNSGHYRFKKNKKIYFTDPLLYHLSCHLNGSEASEEDYGKIAEMVAHEFLAQQHKRLGYMHNRLGEIDFISPSKWAREVKWADLPTNLSKAYLKLNVMDKKVWIKKNFLQ